MKKLILSLVVFSFLLVIGCQENSITDPILTSGQQDISKTKDSSTHTGTITLEGALTDPHPVMNSFYLIDGEVQYLHTIRYPDPIPPNPQYFISLHLDVSAKFTYLCTVCDQTDFDVPASGTISASSDDIVYVSEDGVAILEKSFAIQGRNDGMTLNCRFIVTTDGVGLDSMWLTLGDDQIIAKNIVPPVTYPPVKSNKVQ